MLPARRELGFVEGKRRFAIVKCVVMECVGSVGGVWELQVRA